MKTESGIWENPLLLIAYLDIPNMQLLQLNNWQPVQKA